MKYTTRTVNYVDYSELDRATKAFVAKKGFPGTPEIACDEELNNDSEKEFAVVPKAPDAYSLERFKKGNYSYRTGKLLDWMCLENEIPSGSYLVGISW